MNTWFVRYNGEVISNHQCSSSGNLSIDKIYEVIGTNCHDLETGELMQNQVNLILREVRRGGYKQIDGEFCDRWFREMPVELGFMLNDAPKPGARRIKFTTFTPRGDGQSLMPRTSLSSSVVDYQVFRGGVYRVITQNTVYIIRVFS